MCSDLVAWIKKANGKTNLEGDAENQEEVMGVLTKSFIANRGGIVIM